jgi:biopolymer transport protein ExbB/TolQ
MTMPAFGGGSFEIPNIGVVAWCVVGTLFVMSVLSLGVIAERWWAFRLGVRESKAVALEASRLLRSGQLKEAQEMARRPSARHSHLARLIASGLREWEQDWGEDQAEIRIETVRTALCHSTAESVVELRRGLVLLGSIASSAPFVGLFGTTFGIINAFSAMALTGAGGLSAISAGISEALITTAFGLLVAIPALWAYNGLGGRVERLSSELARASDQLLMFLARRA